MKGFQLCKLFLLPQHHFTGAERLKELQGQRSPLAKSETREYVGGNCFVEVLIQYLEIELFLNYIPLHQ